MVTYDDVAKVVFDRQAADSGYAATLPGKAWTDRGPPGDPADHPYSVAKIESGPARNNTGDLYTQSWTVSLAAYVPVGHTGANVQAVRQLFHNALVSAAAITALRAVALRNATEKILSAKLVTGKGEYARELREGRDVLLVGMTAELLIQGDKGAT